MSDEIDNLNDNEEVPMEQPSDEEATNNENINDEATDADAEEAEVVASAVPLWDEEAVKTSQLHGMYRAWFLDYASYVILDRAVPHIDDGFKPVQRRILHAMSLMEDGRFNKVANIVGSTMPFHPHGDASIGDALVQLGQKGLLIDTQGNWGNILTGDEAAAPRYIEARLTKFALDVVFNKKTTQWMLSYDGRNDEPVTLPVKFPLLLAHGAEGIAVGLSTKILPHNFNELIDASIAYLRNEPFTLLPDFPTGGLIDASKYNDGQRGGSLRVRARIEKRDARTIVITEVPFTKTTQILRQSIENAAKKGKIKVRKIDDLTSENAEIVITLPADTSPDKTIDALYAFTDCELNLAPNACVVYDRKPHFLGVSDILKHSTDRTVSLLKRELEINLEELETQWHLLSLEKIFIEERIYKDKEFEQASSTDAACEHIDERLTPYYKYFTRAVTKEDILHLLEIKMARILRFNSDAAEEKLARLKEEMETTRFNIEHIIEYTIDYFKRLKRQYGKDRERKTEIRSFDKIETTKVVVRNKKLYVNKADGFMGMGLKPSESEYVADCSELDDAIIFYKDGRYCIKHIDEKVDIGNNVIHIDVFKKNDTRTIYTCAYADGETGITYIKRFAVTGVIRDKEYNMTTETPKTVVHYFSVSENGESEVLTVLLKPKLKLHKVVFDFDTSSIAVKGRSSRGNILTKNEVHKIKLRRKGESTLGGQQIWFEPEILRLNDEGRGTLLGEFCGSDLIFLVMQNGEASTVGTGLEQHFNDGILRIEKFDNRKIWTAVYLDAKDGMYYIKRFRVAADGCSKPVMLAGDDPNSRIVLLSDEDHPRIEISYGGSDKWRPKEIIEVDDFAAEKGIKSKGKRITQHSNPKFVELEPTIPTIRESPVDKLADDVAKEDDATDDGQLEFPIDN